MYEFNEIEEMMEEYKLELGEKYDDSIHEEEMGDFIESPPDHQIAEDHQNENVPLELKEDSFERIETVQEPIPENYAETGEFPEYLIEGAENIERVSDDCAAKEFNEWEEGDEIVEEDLPSSPFIQPINKTEELYREIGIMTDEEMDGYDEYIHKVTMNKDHEVIMDIPMPENTEFRPPVETPESASRPFSSMDYQREHPFNKYSWKLNKIFEKVKYLGIDYSSVSDEEGKENIHKRYNDLVQDEFREEDEILVESYKKFPELFEKTKKKLFERVANLNSKINKCKQTWDKYSNWE